jgi:hypothetical protein
MGYSTQSVPFFTDDIAIHVSEGTEAHDIGKRRTLRGFARGQRMSLERIIETGEYVATRQDGTFIRGPEALE